MALHPVIVRRLRATVLLALGVIPAEACRGTVILDCTHAALLPDGLERCGGVLSRPKATTCMAPPPSNPPACMALNLVTDCSSDSGCVSQANGRCMNSNNGGVACTCSYGCAQDSDCSSGQVCVCGDNGGVCTVADCATNSQCGAGHACIVWSSEDVCQGTATTQLSCTTSSDECFTSADCGPQETCFRTADRFACINATCHTGRPFYVGGELRTAPLSRSAAWAEGAHADVSAATAEQRAASAARWEHVGQLEHASIASFARFSLQLLSLGAPPELVDACTAAMADETRHARLAFGLASHYRGEPVGPGKLDIDHALAGADIEGIVTTLIHEGCVGETFAAALAREELERTSDAAVRSVLSQIAEDEERHAVFAWRALAWLASEYGEPSRTVATEALARFDAEIASSATTVLPDGVSESVLSDAELYVLRSRVLSTVVRPALALVFAPRGSDRSGEGVTAASEAPAAPVPSSMRIQAGTQG